jgi:proteasome accessory factor B
VSAAKTERLLNLVIALLATRRPLSAESIRRAVPGYAEDDEAFHRMLERDKQELRELGIPLETVSSTWDDQPGYRIARRDYELPDIHLEPDEAAAVGVAAQVWQEASLGEPAAWARRKLAAAGEPVEVALPTGLEPRLEATEPALPAVTGATTARTPIRFRYRPAGGGQATERHLEPWGMVSRYGRWYVVGHDRDRDAPRAFRLSRIVGEVRPTGAAGSVPVPAGVDLLALVDSARPDPSGEGEAVLRVRSGRAGDLRREAVRLAAGDAGWDEIAVRYGEAGTLLPRLAGYGADVVVLAPESLRAAMVDWLEAVAGAVQARMS